MPIKKSKAKAKDAKKSKKAKPTKAELKAEKAAAEKAAAKAKKAAKSKKADKKSKKADKPAKGKKAKASSSGNLFLRLNTVTTADSVKDIKVTDAAYVVDGKSIAKSSVQAVVGLSIYHTILQDLGPIATIELVKGVLCYVLEDDTKVVALDPTAVFASGTASAPAASDESDDEDGDDDDEDGDDDSDDEDGDDDDEDFDI